MSIHTIEALQFLFPNFNSRKDAVVTNRNGVLTIDKWNRKEKQPTASEIDATVQSAAFKQWASRAKPERLGGEVDLWRAIFKLANEVRKLNGQPAMNRAQFSAFLKTLSDP